jgi:hypothetical protein
MDVMTVITHKGDFQMIAAEHAEATKSTRKRVRDTKSKKTSVSKKLAKTSGKAQGRDGSKTATVLALLRRKDGASTAELIEATGWQPHSVRGFLAGTLRKKMGLNVVSNKREEGERRYSIDG